MNIAPTNNQKSCVFFNEEGYVEMVFFGMVGPSEFGELLCEMNRLAKIHGPTGFLLDGRYGRIPHDARTLRTFAKLTKRSGVTHMVILTHTAACAAHGKEASNKRPTGSLVDSRGNAFGIPQMYLCNEAEARHRAAHQGYVAMFYGLEQYLKDYTDELPKLAGQL